jgi:putative DNA primase/helicase
MVDAPTAQGLKTSLDALEAEANHGKEEKVFLRVGQAAGKIYLDLGNEKWEAVEISAEDWEIVKIPAVYFRRPKGMRPLSKPERAAQLQPCCSF